MKQQHVSRREFLRRTFASGAAGAAILTFGRSNPAEAASSVQWGTLIDLTKCDGCKNEPSPRCVEACRVKNQSRFPEPQKPLMEYWPKKGFEDWSEKRGMKDRLTPYNWTMVQKVQVDGKEINIPRRCMHCDNPPCADLCPFGAQNKEAEGPVTINENLCMGGAKCRDVCPWGIPMRQAGVGVYLNLAPKLAGGGSMFKCDGCIDWVRQGKTPACVEACPQKAVVFGDKEALRKQADERAKEINGFVYGDKEAGGTATFYVSPVSFEAIDQALKNQKVVDGTPGKPHMKPGVENVLETTSGALKGMLIAPLAGMVVAGFAAYKTMKGEKTDERG